MLELGLQEGRRFWCWWTLVTPRLGGQLPEKTCGVGVGDGDAKELTGLDTRLFISDP